MRVMHFITGLEAHGAERMLARLVTALDGDEVETVVVSLTTEGPVGRQLRDAGVEVIALDVDKLTGGVRGPSRLAAELRAHKPDVLQTWLYDADLMGGLVGRLRTKTPVVWNLRQVVPDVKAVKPRTRWVIQACARLSSRVPARIICCAPEVLSTHADAGYDPSRMVVIPNGTDTAMFCPDPVARDDIRAELGIDATTPLVGLVARFAPQKDHATFVAAAAEVSHRHPDARFVLCGEGAVVSNADLAAMLRGASLEHAALLVGPREDIARITAALDVAVSSSAFGEGYPNAVAEALATGVVCAVTDVGHSAALVGDAGRVVEPRDPEALAGAISALLALTPDERAALGAQGRKHIEAEASIDVVAGQYRAVWEDVARCVA